MYRFMTISSSVLLIFLCALVPVHAEKFSFKFKEGDEYRVLSEVDQEVYINGRLSHTAFILNRIAVKVGKVEAGRAWHEAEYVTSEESTSAAQVYHQATNYQAAFWRSLSGQYEIADGFFVPTVRNVPVFPDRDLKPGDSWKHPGSEVQDLRPIGIQKPFEYLMEVQYRYVGIVQKDKQTLHEFNVEYPFNYKVPRPQQTSLRDWPVMVSGFSRQRLLWDAERGRPESTEDNYLIVLTFNSGINQQFQGTATGRVLDAAPLDTAKTLSDINKTLEDLQLQDVKVRKDDEGITISIEDIQFEPDSAVLQASEKQKIQSIAQILKQYPNNDIMISGHTALRGTPEGRKKLSEERAQTVGQFLLDLGVRNKDQIMVQGFGAEKPVADNASDEGLRRNRRVEITILNN